MQRSHWQTLGRLAVAGLLISLVLRRSEAPAVGSALAGASAGWLLAALALVFAAVVVSAHRWGLLLAATGIRPGLARLTMYYLAGLFANHFLPSSIGGDAARLWLTGRQSGRTATVAASVVVERLTGGWVLCATAAAGLVAGGHAFYRLAPAVGLLLLVLAAISLILFRPAALDRIAAWADRRRWARAAGGLRQVAAGIAAHRRRPGLLAAVLGWAVAFQITVSAVNLCLLRALGHAVSWPAAAVLTALALAVMTVPVSIGGLGVREAAYVHLFGAAGVPAAAAFAASLLFFAAVAVVSLPGAIVLLHGLAAARPRPGATGRAEAATPMLETLETLEVEPCPQPGDTNS